MKSQRLVTVLTEVLPDPVSIVGEGILNDGNKMIVYGKPKAMKSIGVKRLALNLLTGSSWLGHRVTAGQRILYLQMEITKREMQKRLQEMAQTDCGTGDLLVWTQLSGVKLDTAEGLAEVVEEIAAVQPSLVIIDPVYKTLTGDMLNAQSMTPVFDNLDKLIAASKVSIVLIHHSRKGVANPKERHVDGDAEDMMGSILFSAWPDSVVRVKRDKQKLDFRVEFAREAGGSIEDVSVGVSENLLLIPDEEVV